jgi:hypothetical protein
VLFEVLYQQGYCLLQTNCNTIHLRDTSWCCRINRPTVYCSLTVNDYTLQGVTRAAVARGLQFVAAKQRLTTPYGVTGAEFASCLQFVGSKQQLATPYRFLPLAAVATGIQYDAASQRQTSPYRSLLDLE